MTAICSTSATSRSRARTHTRRLDKAACSRTWPRLTGPGGGYAPNNAPQAFVNQQVNLTHGARQDTRSPPSWVLCALGSSARGHLSVTSSRAHGGYGMHTMETNCDHFMHRLSCLNGRDMLPAVRDLRMSWMTT